MQVRLQAACDHFERRSKNCSTSDNGLPDTSLVCNTFGADFCPPKANPDLQRRGGQNAIRQGNLRVSTLVCRCLQPRLVKSCLDRLPDLGIGHTAV